MIVMTGITWVSKERIFSNLNILKVVTTTSRRYADCLGFTFLAKAPTAWYAANV